MFEPNQPIEKIATNPKLQQLDNKTLKLLIHRLNDQKSESCVWVSPDVWSSYSDDDAIGFSPCPARAMFHSHIHHAEVDFSTFRANIKNSVITYKSNSTGIVSFGRISSIFTHRRSPHRDEHLMDTWLQVQNFPPVPRQTYNPFKQIKEADVQTYLRLWTSTAEEIIRLDEVIAHCAWLMYKPGEIHREVQSSTIALLTMNR